MGIDQYDQYDQSLEEDGLDRDCGTSNFFFPIFESPRVLRMKYGVHTVLQFQYTTYKVHWSMPF